MRKSTRLDPRSRALAKITAGNGCWLWTGALTPGGYGELHLGGHVGRTIRAHRFMYEWLVGPIPDGLTLDHLCHNTDPTCPGGRCDHRRCVRPDHLEPITLEENKRRGKSLNAVNARKTHCLHGHEFTPENTRIEQRNGHRHCRTCDREREARRWQNRNRQTA